MIGNTTYFQITDHYPIPTPNANIGVTPGHDGSIWFNEDGGNKIGRLEIPPPPH